MSQIIVNPELKLAAEVDVALEVRAVIPGGWVWYGFGQVSSDYVFVASTSEIGDDRVAYVSVASVPILAS